MRILSLFDGAGCLYMSLVEAGIKIDKYYASEIEPIPIRFTKHNFPDVNHVGDVVKLRYAMTWKPEIFSKFQSSVYISKKTKDKFRRIRSIDWSKIDLVGAGSPCQGFSFAGKQLNFNDPRSKLFFEFVKILQHIRKLNPKVLFLLENVNMKKEYQKVINDTLGIFPARINSNLVSAQNRDRLYWTNIRTRQVGLFGELHSDIPQPKDRGILLKDILQDESEVDEKYYLSERMTNTLLNHANKRDQEFQTHSQNGKSKCITVSHQKQNIDSNYVRVAMRGRETTCLTPRRTEYGKKIRKDYESGKIKEQRKNIQQLEPREDGKTNTITSVQKDNLILQKPHGFNKGGEFKEKSPTLLSNSWEHNNHVSDGYKLRRLTPTECARLQTIPEWVSFEGFSDSAIYKMLGNGWTVETIKHILSFI